MRYPLRKFDTVHLVFTELAVQRFLYPSIRQTHAEIASQWNSVQRQFQRHDCAMHHQSAASLDPSSFTARARSLIMRGFKPKDAAEITMQEIIFESRDDPDVARSVRIEAKDFLERVKEGLI
jgi:hypothetical protein